MKKWELVESALMPGGKTISLYEHDGKRSIRIDGLELMSTRQHASEGKLAELGCGHLVTKPHARVLIGGLGFGFTLRAALKMLLPSAAITVAELSDAVIRWNAPTDSGKRVQVVHSDVAVLIREARNSFDAVLLDVDNGPDAISSEGNAKLYDAEGLSALRGALKGGGRVAFWSAGPSAQFEKRMRQAGFKVKLERLGSHVIFLGHIDTVKR